jgi:hypothetical protein
MILQIGSYASLSFALEVFGRTRIFLWKWVQTKKRHPGSAWNKPAAQLTRVNKSTHGGHWGFKTSYFMWDGRSEIKDLPPMRSHLGDAYLCQVAIRNACRHVSTYLVSDLAAFSLGIFIQYIRRRCEASSSATRPEPSQWQIRYMSVLYGRVVSCIVLHLSQNKGRYGMRTDQTFTTLTKFIENTCNIYISKQFYYESIFNDLSNDTSNVL